MKDRTGLALTLALVLSVAPAASVSAQERPDDRFAAAQLPQITTLTPARVSPPAEGSLPDPSPARHPAVLTIGGLAGGAVSAVAACFAGAWIGARFVQRDYADLAGCGWGISGGWLVGVPIGVHLANARRGSLARSFKATAIIAGIGIPAAIGIAALGRQEVSSAISVAIPIVHFVAVVQVERETARKSG